VDAIQLLKEQHREVEDLFAAATKASGAEREQIFDELLTALVSHDAIEREIFYPECERALGDVEILGESLVEHGLVEFSLHLCDEARKKDDFEHKLVVLKEVVEHHVEEEEKELFPKLKKELDKEDLEALGERLEKRFEAAKKADARAALRDSLKNVLGGSLTRAKRSGDKKPATKRAASSRAGRHA
jgi:hemerythrin-like domain-containing protein